MRLGLVLLILCTLSLTSFAAFDSDDLPPPPDPAPGGEVEFPYERNYKFFLNTGRPQLSVRSQNSPKAEDLWYQPQNLGSLGVGISWPEGLQFSGQSFGASHLANLAYFDDQNSFELDTISYRGMFRRTKDATKEEDRPDLRFRKTAFSWHYLFRPERYSYRDLKLGNYRRVHDGGGWLLLGRASGGAFEGDSVFAQGADRSIYGEAADLMGAKFGAVSWGGGYGYAWRWEKNIISAEILLAFGNAIVETSFPGKTKVENRDNTYSDLNFSWIHMMETWDLGIILSNPWDRFPGYGAEVGSSGSSVVFFGQTRY